MSRYLFLFGRTPALSLLELVTFFPSAEPIDSIGAMVDGDIDPAQSISRLGGTVKIATIVDTVVDVTPFTLAQSLTKHTGVTHITFGISRYDTMERVSRAFLTETKKQLDGLGKASRFIEAQHESSLSSVVVQKQHVTELVVIQHKNKTLVGITSVVQDFESWNRRDYDRPFADPKSGMLPPKVARMVVNTARSYQSGSGLRKDQGQTPSSIGQTPILLDPFCGMGTILAEALLIGWNVVGSDILEEVVQKASKNLAWLTSTNRHVTMGSSQLFYTDATHISEKLESESIDAIVTEPFMGSSDIENRSSAINHGKIKNRIKGLEKLYIGCLKDWYKVLKVGGKIVIAIPKYYWQGNTYVVKKVIDKAEFLGYTQLVGPIEYSRPQAIVRRQFYVFQKKSNLKE